MKIGSIEVGLTDKFLFSTDGESVLCIRVDGAVRRDNRDNTFHVVQSGPSIQIEYEDWMSEIFDNDRFEDGRWQHVEMHGAGLGAAYERWADAEWEDYMDSQEGLNALRAGTL